MASLDIAESEHEQLRFPSILEGMSGIENKHYGHQVRAGSPSSSTAASTASSEPVLDPLILQGLRVVKDRILLLRSDMELETFLKDTSATRLRIVPPAFPPSLNSFQRLLVHRLADMWGVARELEQASLAAPAHPGNTTGSALSAVMVLVKTAQSAIPAIRITSLIPEEAESTPIQQPMVLALTHSNVDALPKGGPPQMPVLEQPSLDIRDSSQLLATDDGPVPVIHSPDPVNTLLAASSPALGQYRIMARSVPPSATSSSATSTSRDGETRSSSTSPTSRMSGSSSTMTFEQREAKYMEARLRIFSQGGESEQTATPPLPAAPDQQTPAQAYAPIAPYGTSQHGFAPATQPGQIMYAGQPVYQDANSAQVFVPQPLRPSAPAFVYPAQQASMPSYQAPQQHSLGAGPQGNIVYGSYTVPGPVPFADQVFPPQLAPQPSHPVPYQYQAQVVTSPEVQQLAPSYNMSLHSRPTSSHSHSSHSSLSTTTSASSIRTASTSSARHKARGQGSIDMRPMRQSSVAIPGPAGRQRGRPTASNASSVSGISLPSTGSSSKARQLPKFQPSMSPSEDLASETSSLSNAPLSQRPLTSSRGSASTSPSRSTSYSISEAASSSMSVQEDSSEDNSRAPSQGRSSRTSSPERERIDPTTLAKHGLDKGAISAEPLHYGTHIVDSVRRLSLEKGKERANDQESAAAKANLPERPEWAIRKGRTRQISDKPETSGSVDTLEAPAVASQSPVRNPLATLPPPATEGFQAGLTDQPKPTPACTPALPSTSTQMAIGSSDSASSIATKSNTQAKPSNQPKIVELAPLRYDPGKGWATLNTPKSPSTHVANVANTAKLPRQSHDNGHRMPSQVPQTAFPGFQPSQSMAHPMHAAGDGRQPVSGQPYGTAPSFGQPPMQQYFVQMPYSQPPPTTVTYGQQVFYAQPAPAPQLLQPQQMPQQFMHYPEQGTYYMQSGSQQPQIFAGHQAPHYQQDGSVPQAGHYPAMQPQPVQMIPMHNGVPHQGFTGAMTAADIIATGEMLYSYDIPRPVPRSGATLFDPNATSAR